MTVIHATDPTTQVLSLLYQQREDVRMFITERNTSSDVQRAICADDVIMMLGHGNEYGLFSKPDKSCLMHRKKPIRPSLYRKSLWCCPRNTTTKNGTVTVE